MSKACKVNKLFSINPPFYMKRNHTLTIKILQNWFLIDEQSTVSNDSVQFVELIQLPKELVKKKEIITNPLYQFTEE